MIDNYIKQEIKKSIDTKGKILQDDNLINLIKKGSMLCTDALKNGNKILSL